MRWFIMIIVALVGLPPLLGGVSTGVERMMLLVRGISATGAVVDHETSLSTSREKGQQYNTVMYYPIVEFQAESGQVVRFKAGSGQGGTPDKPVGSSVPVRYNPEHPEEAQVDTFKYFWLGPLGATLFGALMLAFGLWIFLKIGALDREREAQAKHQREAA